MSWWYVSSPRITCAVEVEDGVIVGGAPVIKTFIGQPATNLGDWLRAQGEVRFERIQDPAAPGVPGSSKTANPAHQVGANGSSEASPEGNDGGTGAAGYVFAWGNNTKRAELKGRLCRIVCRGSSMRSVMVEFENGQREIVSYRALRERRTE
jgi:hypothetical protein